MFLMKKFSLLLMIIVMVFALAACGANEATNEEPKEEIVEVTNEVVDEKDYSGTFTGYSWKGEAKGTTLEEASQKIETTLTLDSEGVITDAKMLFLKKNKEGNWYARQDSAADVSVDFTKTPTIATTQNDTQEYVAGESMFSIKTADMMAFYAAAVDEDGTAALAIVDPYTRYQFEFKMDADFDFTTMMKDMTIGNGNAVPTIRTSGSGNVKPKTWDEYADYGVLSFYKDPYVLLDQGVFAGLTGDSTIQEYLEKTGVEFDGNKPVEMAVVYGFTGVGGWEGNYKAIEASLIGKNAKEVTSLIDWTNPKYSAGINADNFFGVDVVTGATKTAQNSSDTISGATVRASRESASYQRALVEAGIITEEEVIKGRF